MNATSATLTHAVIDERSRNEMQEAVREIQILAGLDRSKSPGEEPRRRVTIGVTSPGYGDGKSTIAIALASSLGHDFGDTVTLVDADLQTHSLGRQYSVQDGPGLTEVLTGEATIEAATYQLAETAVRIVPAGKPKIDPARLARSERFGEIVDELRAESAYMVLDLPAVLHSMNAPALAQRCDGIVVVLRHGKTTREELDRTLHLLSDVPVLGIVINRHRTSIPAWVRTRLGIRR